MSQELSVVLWNAREAKEKCDRFVENHAQLRNDLYEHYLHKGHLALRYEDSWKGFLIYCRERLKLELNEATIRLQINTVKVSREVGQEVPMVISRQLAKLPPEKQKEVYDEVVGARVVAGQRSANQMEPDVRKAVRREMGVIETAQEARTADFVPETANHPTVTVEALETAYNAARALLCRYASDYEAQDKEALLADYMDVRQFLATYP